MSSAQLEEERGSKHALEHRLQEAARAEQALTAELRALHVKLRCQRCALYFVRQFLFFSWVSVCS